MSVHGTESGGIPRCSFCHMSRDDVAYLIASPVDNPRAFICDECVEVCRSILEDNRKETQADQVGQRLRTPRRDENRPDFAASFELHVLPSRSEKSGDFGGLDFRVLRGYTLRRAISILYGQEAAGPSPIRISLPVSLEDDKRYDFSILLPEPEDREKIEVRMQQGLESYFQIAARRENRMTDVYVVMAVPGCRPPIIKREADEEMGTEAGFLGYGRMEVQLLENPDGNLGKIKPINLSAVRSVSFSGTMDEFCRMLEGSLDRPVVDETHWEVAIEVRVEGVGAAASPFLERLRDHAGLTIAPAQRNIATLVFDLR